MAFNTNRHFVGTYLKRLIPSNSMKSKGPSAFVYFEEAKSDPKLHFVSISQVSKFTPHFRRVVDRVERVFTR